MIDAAFSGIPFPSLMAFAIVGVALIIGSLTDLKTREVPDFLNYGLILLGLAMNGLFSVMYADVSYILGSVVGLGLMFALAAAMFYTGQWGGGDSKMLMGLGAVIGIPLRLEELLMVSFFLNLLIVGAFYGLLWSVGLAVWRWKRFSGAARRILSARAQVNLRLGLMILMIAVLLVGVFSLLRRSLVEMLALLAILLAAMYYVWVFVKAVEKACMVVALPVSKLTEGDWIARDVMIEGKRICGPKDLGLEKRQLSRLKRLASQGKVKKVMVKQGIPFVPSFLFAFLATLWIGNPLSLILGFV